MPGWVSSPRRRMTSCAAADRARRCVVHSLPTPFCRGPLCRRQPRHVFLCPATCCLLENAVGEAGLESKRARQPDRRPIDVPGRGGGEARDRNRSGGGGAPCLFRLGLSGRAALLLYCVRRANNTRVECTRTLLRCVRVSERGSLPPPAAAANLVRRRLRLFLGGLFTLRRLKLVVLFSRGRPGAPQRRRRLGANLGGGLLLSTRS